MKLSTFHKQRGDEVLFCKGEDKTLIGKSFDRIYINSLFTFEWKKTQKSIKFAYKLSSNKNIIYLGGIAATLLTDFIKSEEPEINVVSGLLNIPGKLNIPNDEKIDTLPPDYSILDQITYKYPTDDAYFSYATRGCGMNCSFCAVQKLEPIYVDYVCIKEQINNVIKQCGTKRNLMLMDNNVLKSPQLSKIVDDIVSLGFGKGAKYVNPKTNKLVKRHVDFNQGLDANFLTQDKANLLAKLELNPVRIAFDHIQQKEKYIKAIRTCFNAGLRSFSNYLLYNSDEASWKGQQYKADSPADLYTRLKINVDLKESLQKELDEAGIKEKVQIYSFPMRYIPLVDTERGYIGTYWNKKHLRAIQVFLTPTQGKGVSSHTFFNASFGATLDEFLLNLDMPENIMVRRGSYIKKVSDSKPNADRRYENYLFNQNLLNEWLALQNKLSGNNLWNSFVEKYVSCNIFNIDIFKTIDCELQKEMYLYYLTPRIIAKNIPLLDNNNRNFINKTIIQGKKYLSLLISI